MESKRINFTIKPSVTSEWQFLDVPSNLTAFPQLIEDVLPVVLSEIDQKLVPKHQTVIFVDTVAEKDNVNGAPFRVGAGSTTRNGDDIFVKTPSDEFGCTKSLAATHRILHETHEKQYWSKKKNKQHSRPGDPGYSNSEHEIYADQKTYESIEKATKAKKDQDGYLIVDPKYFDL